MAKIEDKLKILPALPGCYLMKNKDGDIIYVGKAKKLKNRVRQYFVGAHDFKTTRLVSNIDDFEYIVTSSEKEVFELLIANYSTKEIAKLMNISDKTVRNHISNVMLKLGVKGRAQAVVELLKLEELTLE